jgi:2-keto-4-pentenoate hydratase/2-oxohepta-3-ene-1,7-dioic acid hydratase in catechol pathway
MGFDVVEHLSSILTRMPGGVILSGTPQGVRFCFAHPATKWSPN